MEKETGSLLYEKESHQQLEPASVTKVMTLLLIMEGPGRRTAVQRRIWSPSPPPLRGWAAPRSI